MKKGSVPTEPRKSCIARYILDQRHGRATWEMSAFFQTFRACLIVGPGNHTRKHQKYNEHDCAHHHGVEWHRNDLISKRLDTNLVLAIAEQYAMHQLMPASLGEAIHILGGRSLCGRSRPGPLKPESSFRVRHTNCCYRKANASCDPYCGKPIHSEPPFEGD